MKYFPPFTDYPKNSPYRDMINDAAETLEQKLRHLNYQHLSISDYYKRYYSYDLGKITFMLQAYSIMMASAIQLSGKPISEITLLDHGGGVGILSLLAKLIGVKTVIHQDIDPVVSADARTVAGQLGIPVEHYICGETRDFVEFVNQNNLNLNIIASRNVIEHVYDLNEFFRETSRIKSDTLVLYINTTANVRNPLVNSYTKRLQKIYEHEGFSDEWGSRKKDKKNAALEVRKKIIKEYANTLTKSEIEKLAINTRGKRKDDIIKCVDEYLADGTMARPPLHSTNTCDPNTGSWLEHLVPINKYKELMEDSGFEYSYKNGFYNTNYPQPYLNLVTPVLNFKIKLLNNLGIILAPFITIIGVKRAFMSRSIQKTHSLDRVKHPVLTGNTHGSSCGSETQARPFDSATVDQRSGRRSSRKRDFHLYHQPV
jgi:2-polyprenyl-3-methyl-5-hydroxy-6-metoxy-1,4-benzoquinol methylase